LDAQGGDVVMSSGLHRHAGSLLGAGAAGGLTVRHKAAGAAGSSTKQGSKKRKGAMQKGEVWGSSAKQQAFKKAHEQLDQLCLVRAPRFPLCKP
jgi:hypothetical protein